MDRVEAKRNISLVGFMYSGKSSVGREAARKTGLELVDLDTIIEERMGMTVGEIFSRHGEERFRDIESDILREVCRKEGQFIVPGGGILVRSHNRELLRRSAGMIWLRIGIEELLKRIDRIGDYEVRPLLRSSHGREEIELLLAEREKQYRDSDIVIDVDGREFAEVVELVVDSVHRIGFR